MTIQREPHRAFAAFWIAWIIATPFVAVDTNAWTYWGWLLSFLAVELTASFWDTHKRDTLSECATWLHRKLSKGDRTPWKAWGAFFSLIIDMIGATATRPLWQEYFREVVFAVQCVVIPVLLFLWLYYHWVSPEENG